MKTLADTFTKVESLNFFNLIGKLLDKRPNMDASIQSKLVYDQQGGLGIAQQSPDACDAVGEISLEIIRRTPNPIEPALVQPSDLAFITMQVLTPSGPAERPVLTLLVPFSDPMFDWSPRPTSIEVAYLLKLGEIFEEYRGVERVSQVWIQSKLLSELEEESRE